MSRLDPRVVGTATLAGVVSLIAPVTLGGAILALGIVSAILTVRSVVRSNESDVTTAIVVAVITTSGAVGASRPTSKRRPSAAISEPANTPAPQAIAARCP